MTARFTVDHLHRWRVARALALIAIVAAALVPTLSRLMAAAAVARGELVQVCTPQGMRFVAISATPGEGYPVDASAAADTCPYCATHGLPPALPAAAPPSLPRAASRTPIPTVDAPVAGRRAFATAPPRGPPLAS